MTVQSSIGQKRRLIILSLYVVGLFVASKAAFGNWIPPTSEDGLWFYAALAALLLGSLLVTPFFTKPADAISYAVASAVALLAVNPWLTTDINRFDRFTWSASILYVFVVLAASVLAISLKDSSRLLSQKLGRSALLIADVAGSPRAIFSVVFFFALITYHRTKPREYLIISLAWALFVGLRPLEAIENLWRRWLKLWTTQHEPARLGEVISHETPGSVLIKEDSASTTRFGEVLFVRTESGQPGIAIALDHVGFAGGRWLRAIHLTKSDAWADAVQNTAVARLVCEGLVFFNPTGFVNGGIDTSIQKMRRRLIGLVAAETNIDKLQIELVRTDLDLQEGSLVEVDIKGRSVLYQVINGFTKEEILQEKNTRGFVRAQAKKVGFWKEKKKRFDPVPWLPRPNQPVLVVSPAQTTLDKEVVGHFPGTSYPVYMDPTFLVTHNTAILGILGVGKSFLALELVERMIRANIKVVCLDLTDQYAKELEPFLDADTENKERQELEKIGQVGKMNVQKNVEEGGSTRKFAAKMQEQLKGFLEPNNKRKLRIINPAQFEVWRQDSKPFQNQASMATLTPTEITRIITEATLNVLQAQGMTDCARCCIVYEEAHSLIPEWSAVASEGDKTATNGTAKTILQGRKFGLGCLVITQRTANVTKSILNQCNTVFALRVFDATGMEFLKNYIGEDYAAVLSTLDDRHAVIFGRASSCRDPVLTRLNDRPDFLKVFRKPQLPTDGSETEL